MHKIRNIGLLAAMLLASLSTAWALTGLPEKTLAERVDLATHVIIGTATKVRVMKIVVGEDGKIERHEVVPTPDSLQGTYAEIEIEVEEVLYPAAWQPPKTILYGFGGGWFSVQDIRKDVLGKRLLYLMQDVPPPPEQAPESTFLPSYPWNLCESLEEKAEIQASLRARVQREKEAQDKQQK